MAAQEAAHEILSPELGKPVVVDRVGPVQLRVGRSLLPVEDLVRRNIEELRVELHAGQGEVARAQGVGPVAGLGIGLAGVGVRDRREVDEAVRVELLHGLRGILRVDDVRRPPAVERDAVRLPPAQRPGLMFLGEDGPEGLPDEPGDSGDRDPHRYCLAT
ncbi:MAG: hypothetical protein A2902_06150 [Elusimicrobia bacterium RIFCSPLOWO2_01_FULL_64_13]|nr:MAG: hypothetical protein A2902_06150 [Elusimicrobia bacterium RIFCSPLOWO2_01_FULL_64_13]